MTQTVLNQLAAVNKLSLTEKEASETLDLFAFAIDAFEAMAAVDTGAIPPCVHPMPMENVFRDDVVRHDISREVLLQGAPEQNEGCFSVPQLVE